MSSPDAISRDDALDQAGRGAALLVDVREAYRLALRPFAGARHHPLGLLLADPDALPRDVPLVLVDDDGLGARLGARYLRGHGFLASYVRGGLEGAATR